MSTMEYQGKEEEEGMLLRPPRGAVVAILIVCTVMEESGLFLGQMTAVVDLHKRNQGQVEESGNLRLTAAFSK